MLQTSESVTSAAPRGGNSPDQPRFPLPTKIKERKYFPRSAIDEFKRQVQAFALGVEPPPARQVEPDPLVPMKAVAAEFGVTTRTVDRWIAEGRGARATEPA